MHSSSKILFVGICTVDLIIISDGFQSEDSMTNFSDISRQTGGNATNDCRILSLLGIGCEFLGTMTRGFDGQGNSTEFILDEFRKYGISYENCVFYNNSSAVGKSSIIIINSQNGSRTIYHHTGNLPELSYQEFLPLNLINYKWIHFECRNADEYILMVNEINKWNTDHPNETITVSAEVEMPFDGYLRFCSLVDVLFISKEVSRLNGCFHKVAAAKHFSALMKPGGMAICPWGDEGAAACVRDADPIISTTYPPSKVVDTLGCGDTFDSGVIYALSNGQSLLTAIRFGCRLAGYKCGIRGYDGLRGVWLELYEKTIHDIETITVMTCES